jgi:cell division protein FtsI/penicillin-binding protein 2
MKMRSLVVIPILLTFGLFTGLICAATAGTATTQAKKTKKSKKKLPPKTMTGKVVSQTTSSKFVGKVAPASKTFRPTVRRRRVYSEWDEPTYADSTLGDNIDGEDLSVRRAAVEALGPLNGAIVVADPDTGRILAMVNQKLALGAGYQPCSTIKVPVAFAALSEGIIERDTMMRIYGRTKMNLTTALAKSNNQYFAKLGEQLGYERMSYYAHLFGLGEKAGLDIAGEQPGHFPSEPPKNGGMGMLTSFGEEISLTPLQLAAIMGSISNGGTLYYLQHPRTQEEVDNFVPRVKRRLEIENQIAEVRPGMRGAVQYGTARRIQAITEDMIMGKTGTCSERRTHLGWFGSFGEVNGSKVVVSVLLTGGKPCIGPAAAGVAGGVYKRLSDQNYSASRTIHQASLVSQSSSGN